MGTNVFEDLVIQSLKEVVEVLGINLNDQIGPETRLFGSKGILKSIELVSLIVDLEEKISDKYGLMLTLADERAMSQKRSPFRSVSSLAEYISTLIEEAKQGQTEFKVSS